MDGVSEGTGETDGGLEGSRDKVGFPEGLEDKEGMSEGLFEVLGCELSDGVYDGNSDGVLLSVGRRLRLGNNDGVLVGSCVGLVEGK